MEILSLLTTLQCKFPIYKKSKKCYPLKLSNIHPGITFIMKDKTDILCCFISTRDTWTLQTSKIRISALQHIQMIEFNGTIKISLENRKRKCFTSEFTGVFMYDSTEKKRKPLGWLLCSGHELY